MRKVLLTGLLIAAFGAVASASAAPPPPSSMAAIGDSITRATDVCCWYGDHPRHSWSTGGAPLDGIRSHYERLRTLQPAITGHNYNDARAGARMRDAPAQAQTAVTQQAEYVTILMGANDVCTSSPSTMTSVEDFRAQFTQTMQVLSAGLPAGSLVFVSSIPNVYRLWQVMRDSPAAQLVWAAARICQSMLSRTNTEADRQAVLAREREFNQVPRRGVRPTRVLSFRRRHGLQLPVHPGACEPARLLPPESVRPGHARLDHVGGVLVGCAVTNPRLAAMIS